ncbi:Guanylate-binding protein 1 [Lemmus lemmus]
MTSEVNMPGPVCLIENVNGQLVANQESLGILSNIKQPVVVVAIVGFYRTGKSYLMNKLAGQKSGFSLGSTVQSETKGIWMWCVPHPQKADHTLVLLDTEGLGDVEKGNNQNDCWIFTLAVLLSSTFVYNSMGAINQQAIDQLHYVTELTDRIRIRSSPDQEEVDVSDEFVSFFPDFIWALRDFCLELKVNGEPISPDEYLENSLNLIQGKKLTTEINLPRLCIQKFFPKKKCFVFDRPANGRLLGQLESLQDQDLDLYFKEQVSDFCSYVFRCSKIKMLSGGIRVNGPRLESLVVTYVNAISSGGLPCMENAVLALSQTENAAAVQKAIVHYDQQMSQKLQLPTETLQELMNLHRASEKEAITIFRQNSFKDNNEVFLKQLEANLETKQEEFIKKNEQESSARCLALLQDIFSPLEEDVKQGIYSKPGGYHLFIQKIQELKKKYYEEPKKGIQAEEVLWKFLQSKEEVSDAILQTDQTLTEKEKEIEVEHVKVEAAQALTKMQQENEQLLQQKEKSYKEHTKQLTDKVEKKEAEMKEMQEKNEQLLQQKERSHEEHIKQLTQKVEKKEAEMKEMQEKNEQFLQQKEKSHEEHMKTLTEKVEMKEAEMREMQKKNEQLLQQKEKSHEEHTKKLTEKVEMKEAEMREMQKKNELLLQQKEKSHEEHTKKLTEKVEMKEAEMREMLKKNELLLQQKEKSYAEQTKELTEKVKKKEAEMREMQKKNEQLLQQKEKSHEEHTKKLTDKVEMKEAEMREMQKKNELLLQQKEKSHEEHTKKLTEKVEMKEAEMREMLKKNELLLQQKEKSYAEQTKELTEKVKKKEAEMREMQKKNEQLQQKEKSHEEQTKELTEKVKKKEAEMREMQKKNEQLRQKKKSHKEQMKKLTEKVEKKDAEMRKLQEENEVIKIINDKE